MAADASITAVVNLDVNDAEKRVNRLKQQIIKMQDEIRKNDYKGEVLDSYIRQKEKELARERETIDSDKVLELQRELEKLYQEEAKITDKSREWETELNALLEIYADAEKEANRLRETQSGAVQDLVSDEESVRKYEESLEKAREDIRSVIEKIKQEWIAPIPELMRLIADSISPKINEAFDNISSKAKDTFDKVKEAAKGKFDAEFGEQYLQEWGDFFNRLAGMASEFGLNFGAKILVAFRDVKDKFPEIMNSIMSGLSDILPKITSVIESAGFSGLGAELLSGISGAIAGIAPEVAIAVAAIKLLIAAFKQMWNAAVKDSVMLANGIKTAFNSVVSAAKEAPDAIKKFVKACDSGLKKVAKLFREITSSIVSFLKNINALSKLADVLNRVFTKLGSTIRRVFVYSTLTSFFRALRTQVSEYLSLNAEFMTALGRLKSALATAFQPILDVIIPALTALINMLTQVVSVIAQFIAALFGTTAKRAQANAKALNSQAGATEKAGNAAEKASQQLAGFDEINSLSFDNGSGGSGGGGGGGGAELGDALFDLDLDDTWFNSWGEAFDAFLDHILEEGIPAFRKAMEDFAGWINWFSENLLEMFTFPGVKDKMRKIGEDIADVLNEFMDLVDFELLGNAIGAGIDDIVALLNGFFDNLDTKKAGKSLAEFINGLVDYVDWYEFGRLLSRGIETGLKALAGFLENLDMPDLAKALSKTIQGFFDQLNKAFSNDIEWGKIGKQIATFFNNLDWYGIITSAAGAISSGVNGFFTMLRELIDELHWDDIAKQIGNAINDSLDLFDWKLIATTLGDAIEKAFNFLKTIIETINWHEIGEIIGNLIKDFDFVSALGALADLIAAAINAAVQLACGLLDIIEPEAFNIGRGISERIRNAVETVDWIKLGEVVGRAIKTALSFVAGLLDPNTFYAIGKAIGEFFINLDWPGILQNLANAIANGIKSAVALVRGFLDTVGPNLHQLALDIADKINNFVASVKWGELGKTIHDGIKAALDFLLTILENLKWKEIGKAIVDFLTELDWPGLLAEWQKVIGTAIGGALEAIDLSDWISLGMDMVGGLIKGAKDKFDAEGGILGWIKRTIVEPIINAFLSLLGIASPSKVMAEIGGYMIEGLLQGITETWNTIVEFFSEALATLKEFLLESWENIKTSAFEKWEEIKETISEKWENIKESINEAIDNLKETISTAWENIKESTAEAWENIKTSLYESWENIKETISTALETVKENLVSAWENIKQLTSETWENIRTLIFEKWEEIKTSISDAIENVKAKISEAWGNIKSFTAEAWESIRATLYEKWESIKTAISTAIDALKSKISEAWENIRQFTSDKWEAIRSFLSNTWDTIKSTVSAKADELKAKVTETWSNVQQFTSEKWAQIKETLINAWNELKNNAVTKFQEIKQSIIDKVSELRNYDWVSIGKSIVDGIVNGLQSIWNTLTSWAGKVKDTISNAINGAKTAASSALKSVTSTYSISVNPIQVNPIASIGNITIPRLAAGAVIPPNREFAAILGDQDNGRNLEAPEGLIRQIVREESGGGNEQIVSLLEALLSAVKSGKTMVADGKAIAKVVTNEQNRMTRMSGKSILLG